jgi:hypothetical protein
MLLVRIQVVTGGTSMSQGQGDLTIEEAEGVCSRSKRESTPLRYHHGGEHVEWKQHGQTQGYGTFRGEGVDPEDDATIWDDTPGVIRSKTFHGQNAGRLRNLGT